MDTTDLSHSRAQASTCSFTRVAVGFPHTVAIVIARPLVLTVIDRGVRQLQAGGRAAVVL